MLDFEGFREIADSVGAMLMVDMAHIAGLVPAEAIRRPCRTPNRDHHHAQDAARTAQRHDPLREDMPRRSTSRCSPACRAVR